MRYFSLAILSLAIVAQSGCGGSGGNDVAPGVIASPAPTPSPSPAPSPSPTSTSTNLAGAQAGDTLQFTSVCSPAAPVYQNGAITGLQTIEPAALQPSSTARYLGGPERIDAFGGTFYRADNGTWFDRFQTLDDFTLNVARRTASASPEVTFGYTDRTSLCFFAGGLPVNTSSALQVGYTGTVDGLMQTSSATLRLFSSDASATFQTTQAKGTVTLTLSGYTAPFVDQTAPDRVDIGTVTAELAVNGSQVTATTISGLPGYTGTMSGEIVGQRAMALAFQLHAADGSVVWGIVALDNESCQGCWDY